jgi:hypothetical protein
VHIHDRVDAVVFILKLRPVSQRPKVVAKGGAAGRLNAAEYVLFFCGI